MLHNSLLIREILKSANIDPTNLKRRDPHHQIDASKFSSIKMHWKIIVKSNASNLCGIKNAVADFKDFLSKINQKITESENFDVVLSIGLINGEQGNFTIESDAKTINIGVSDTKGLWAAISYLEKEIEINGLADLTNTLSKNHPKDTHTIIAKPQWKVQISQSPRGANFLVPDLAPEYLSDDAFRLLTHYGINGMTIYGDFLCYTKSTIFPELTNESYDENIKTLKDATERAANYGISLYYVPVSPKLSSDHLVFANHPNSKGSRLSWKSTTKQLHCLCSSDLKSLQFHAEIMGNLFKEVPLLGGLILIIGGESYYHCYMRSKRGIGGSKTNCSICSHHSAEKIVSNFVRNTEEAVHKIKPDALIMAWPYSAHGWSNDPNQIEFIDNLHQDVSLLSEIDKDQFYVKDGYKKKIWDYSVDFTGPSDRILAQSKKVQQKNLKLFIKSETALGLEMIHMPYIPCLNRLGEKWKNVRKLSPNGVLQSWMFFGMWGSRAEEIGWWVNWHPELNIVDILEIIAKRDFGSASTNVLETWHLLSEAINHLPCIPGYFTGPLFIGPCNPLLPRRDSKIDDIFQAALYYKQENEETFSTSRLEIYEPIILNTLPRSPTSYGFFPTKKSIKNRGWDLFMSELEETVKFSRDAYTILASINESESIKSLNPIEQALFTEEMHLVKFLHSTLLSNKNLTEFLLIRDNMIKFKRKNKGNRLLEIAKSELINTEESLDLYESEPYLDLKYRFEGKFPSSLEMIKRKIELLNEFIHCSFHS